MLLTLLLTATTAALAQDSTALTQDMSGVSNTSYTTHALGGMNGTLNGITYVFERGSSGQGRHFATQYGTAAGINFDGNFVVLPSIALGSRTFSGQSNDSRTRFVGGYAAVQVELEPEWGTYLYLLAGTKASWGYRNDGGGMDVGLTLAWGQQVAGPWWNYSGIRGGLEVTWVWGG